MSAAAPASDQVAGRQDVRYRHGASNRPPRPSHRCADETDRESEPQTPDTRQYDAASSGTGKTHAALALGLAACQKGFSVAFTTAAALVHQLMEARDERRLLKLQRDLQAVKLLIVDELGYVPLSPTGAELLFEVFSQRYERGSTLVTSNLPFEDWTSVLGSERLTGALLDRLTHHVHILTMNGDSYRLKQSAGRRRPATPADRVEQNQAIAETVDPETGEIGKP
ncbi:MAG TPA: ATP-binding protein [Solirubrobacterales bacterium]